MLWFKNVSASLLISLMALITLEMILKFYYLYYDSKNNYVIKKYYKNPNVTEETINFYREKKNFRTYNYKAFVGWRAPQFRGHSITINTEGFRKSHQADLFIHDPTIHLFGGSTMWGFGVSDKNTIPSLISTQFKVRTINYGEQAYNSRQALNLFIDNIKKFKKGDIVVFYDGVNDAIHNCRSHNSYNGNFNEFRVSASLKKKKTHILILDIIKRTSLYRLATNIVGNIKTKNLESRYKNSCSNPIFAKKVADFTIQNWQAYSSIAKSMGALPLCILQPNPYTLPKRPHSYKKIFAQRLSQVYPHILKGARNLDCFRNLTKLFKKDYYIDDCCHTNSIGNKIISKAIWNEIKKLNE